MTKRLRIIGSGDLGKLIAIHAESSGFEVEGFYDDTIEPYTIIQNGKQILGSINSLFNSKPEEGVQYILGIGYKHFDFRELLFDKLSKQEYKFATIMHPSSYIDPTAIIESGSVIFPRVTIDAGVQIKHNVLINTASTIAHDSIINPHTFIAPSVAIAGFVSIGKKCMLGINCTIIDNINLGDNIIIGANSLVIDSISKTGTYVGSPVRNKIVNP